MALQNTKRKNSGLVEYIRLIMAVLMTVLVPVQLSYAQTVEPMIFDIEPIGNKSSQSMRITNPKSGPITVEVTALSLEFDELGDEINSPAEDDFLIYPPQTIIQAGATQVVKVKYVGDPSITKSKSYRIVISQLPVDLKTDGASGVSVLTEFLTIANVSPAKSRAVLNVIDIEGQQNDDQWVLTVENTGNRYGALSDTSWDLEHASDSSKNKNLTNEQVNGLISRSLVPAKSKLLVLIPAIDGFDPSNTKIKIKNQPNRS